MERSEIKVRGDPINSPPRNLFASSLPKSFANGILAFLGCFAAKLNPEPRKRTTFLFFILSTKEIGI
jgi:hypothetical protein